jgi:alpha-beta hydrolase superfamily lysophospholipase
MSNTLITMDGLQLRTRLDEPTSPPKARIVLVHGIGDQVDGVPYVTAATALAARGLVVHRMELRGHGLSGGRRMYVRSWADFRSDLGQFVRLMSAAQPALPVFLVGISMGGLIVLNFAACEPGGLSGVVALAPALGEPGGSRFLRAILPILSRVLPRLTVDHLDEHREPHREVDVSLRDVVAQPLRHEREPDQQQELSGLAIQSMRHSSGGAPCRASAMSRATRVSRA